MLGVIVLPKAVMLWEVLPDEWDEVPLENLPVELPIHVPLKYAYLCGSLLADACPHADLKQEKQGNFRELWAKSKFLGTHIHISYQIAISSLKFDSKNC